MLGSAYLTALLFATQRVCTYDYSTSATGGSTNCHTRWAMVVPVMGPFVDLAQNKGSSDESTDILIGGGQLAGAIFLFIGLAITTPKLIPDAQGYGISVTPMLASSTTGFSLTLRH
jgi:hypothetical protein